MVEWRWQHSPFNHFLYAKENIVPLYQHFNKQKIVTPQQSLTPDNYTSFAGSNANNTLTYDSTLNCMIADSFSWGNNPTRNTFYVYNLFQSTSTKTFTVKMSVTSTSTSLSAAMIGFKNSSTGRMTTWALRNNGGGRDMELVNWNNVQSANNNLVTGVSWTPNTTYWLRAVDDGTNNSFYASTDGISFGSAIFSYSKSSWSGNHDQVFFGIAPATVKITANIYSLTVT